MIRIIAQTLEEISFVCINHNLNYILVHNFTYFVRRWGLRWWGVFALAWGYYVIDVKREFDGAPSITAPYLLPTYRLGNEKTFPTKLKNKDLNKIMKIDNECLRTSGNSMFKEKVTEFLNFLSESEENKQLPSKTNLQLIQKKTLYNLQKMLLKEKLNIAPTGSPNLKSLSSSILN